MDRRTFLATVCTGTAAVSGCLSLLRSGRADTPLPDVPEGSWTQHGADGANTFASAVSAPPRGNLTWTSAAFTRWSPVIADGTVYTTNFDPSNDGSALALDAQDGSEQWRTTLDRQGDHGRALVDGHFVVAHERELVALDRRNGDVLWRRPLERTDGRSGYAPELLAVDDASGTVLLPRRDGLEAFRVADGEPHWEATEITRQFVTPAIHDGAVYAVGRIDDTPSLAAFALDDGTARWTTTLEEPSTDAAPVATDRGILVADGTTLGVHDPGTGDRRSALRPFADGETVTTVAADGGTAFVETDERILAVDVKTGTTRTLHDGGVYPRGICVGNETVVAAVDGSEYVSDHRETITAFDRETGNVRWSYPLDGFHSLTIPPILADGAVFFATSSIDALAALGDVPAEG